MFLRGLLKVLDSETKRRIDTARDILVGKIPDPKSQIEQITVALIYKFMDDMDKKSEELGGKSKFFTGNYAKYAWNKILDQSISGFELVTLYGEAIQSMNQNPNLPQLFRDIFKNAYLPYRDPETLRAFLRIIDDFKYDHSERLGDAFEYLLSVMGSQGDAGQFRTPRHIIDFIVKVVDPSKKDTILDPACGTAGFLISAYKHIIASNMHNGKLELTPDERKKLVENIVGYDISPDMVRLSLVNLYLHGFKNPHIFEYDTLTSDERWDETFDVCLANPPFMTPKGGIRPHKRFSVDSNRAEVLFVDYMAEHLTNDGKAGIVVPEGIIFQSGSTYKQLRKMLVDNALYAVVSLPAGVFNPYSGVKTSVLFLDKRIVKKSKDILFVKVESDGFGLGAQRREVKDNDLPLALEILQDYQKAVLLGEEPKLEKFERIIAHIVSKEKIGKSGDYNLSVDRYKEAVVYDGGYKLVELEQVADISSGNSAPQEDKYFKEGKYPFYRTSDVGAMHISISLNESKDYVNDLAITENRLTLFPKYTILFPKSGASTFLNHRVMISREGYVSSHLATIQAKENLLIPKYLFYMLCCIDAKQLTPDQAYPSLKLSDIAKIKIPFPPLEVQERIVEEIENYQNIIDGAKKVVESYKPSFKIDSSWETINVDKICNLVRGSSPRPQGDPKYYGGKVPRLMISDVTRDGMYTTPKTDFLTEEGAKLSRPMKKGEVVMAVSGNPGLPTILSIDACIHDGFVGFRSLSKKIVPEFFYFVLLHNKIFNYGQSIGAVFKNLNTEQIKEFKIPLPTIEIQKQIVSQIEEEQKLVDSNKKLIELFEKKVADKIAEVWGE